VSARRGVVPAVLALALACAGTPPGPPLETAERVDLERYLGLWYEIASFPTRFQEGCEATTARYSRREDGRIRVLNACTRDGERDLAEAVAWVPDPREPAKLEVRFFWPFTGDYWILAVGPEDASDYAWALVGHPSRNYLWVLSREPVLDEARYDEIVGIARARGFDVSRLERTARPSAGAATP